jgi:hypothetical protein
LGGSQTQCANREIDKEKNLSKEKPSTGCKEGDKGKGGGISPIYKKGKGSEINNQLKGFLHDR